MRIAVIGAGAMGSILARNLAALGHRVSIANSRGPKSLASSAAEVAFLAIPTKAVVEPPRELFAEEARELVVVDLGNYHPELRDGRIAAIDGGLLDSQWVAQQIGRPVIKAFNNILAASLAAKGLPRGTPGRIALPVAGDAPSAKATVLQLVDDLGFEPLDAGNLDDSWRQQPGMPAYCQDLDASALRRALAQAERSRIAECRAEREASIRRALGQRA